MRTSDVKRWHIVNTTKDQTLAEHHALVSGIATMLLFAVFPDPDKKMVAEVMYRALVHDIDEVHTGDIPSCAKDHEPATDLIEALIKVADSIESYWWIHNNGTGERKAEIVNFNFQKLKSRVRAIEVTFVDKGIITNVVNDMIIELALPYTLP